MLLFIDDFILFINYSLIRLLYEKVLTSKKVKKKKYWKKSFKATKFLIFLYFCVGYIKMYILEVATKTECRNIREINVFFYVVCSSIYL